MTVLETPAVVTWTAQSKDHLGPEGPGARSVILAAPTGHSRRSRRAVDRDVRVTPDMLVDTDHRDAVEPGGIIDQHPAAHRDHRAVRVCQLGHCEGDRPTPKGAIELCAAVKVTGRRRL